MTLHNWCYTIIIACSFCGMAINAQNSANLYPLDLKGTDGLRSGSYRTALDTLRHSKNDPDTSFHSFKLGIAYACVGDTAKALSNFRVAALKDSAIAPFAWEAMGDIAARRKKLIDSAFTFYCRALAMGIPDRYQAIIFEKTAAAIGNDTARIAALPYMYDYRQWLTARTPRPPDSIATLIDSLAEAKQWAGLDSLVTSSLMAHDEKWRSYLVKSIDRAGPPDSVFSAISFFQVALWAMDCRLLDIAEKMLAAGKRKSDFNTAISDQRYRYMRGLLSFYEKKHTDAIPLLTRYLQNYGYDSDLVLILARAYWGLDSTAQAATWYDRYIEKSPRAKSIPEILWRRAWIEEERNSLKEAVRFHKKLYTTYPKSPRAEEAHLRHGLCLYQIGAYDSAIAVFSLFEKKNPTSAIITTALYWKAKSLVARGKTDDARKMLVDIGRAEPHDYYAHRARYLLRLVGDSVNATVALDTIEDDSRALFWLDSVGADTQSQLTAHDSMCLRRGLILGAIGAIDAASIFLEPLDLSYPGKFSLQYRLASFYRDVKALPQAAMIGRRFGWRLPPECRKSIPLTLYRLMYPTYFETEVVHEAQKWNVDPCFVWAVMRQESVFNPKVVSPAGAIGLMQIMPGTGKAIARELQRAFNADSLYDPACNIMFGTWYLRRLLDQFNENEALAVASYNGGPIKAEKWFLRNKSEDLDLFVENIGFSETRNYVKKVLANHWTYRKLTGISALTKN
jgi:soluble lytic murein transglycosylase-like protein/TolA-binding protein